MAFLQKNRLRQKKEGLRSADRRKAGRAITITICYLMMAIPMAGCGKVEEPVPVELSVGDMKDLQGDAVGDADAEGAAGNENAGTKAGSPTRLGDAQQEQNARPAESTQLEGDVRSVNADSFVICKHETWEEDGYSYAVAVAPGYEEESDLIIIHMAQDCGYQYKTVKNSGINPEDVSSREGSFADVKEGLMVTIQGSWQDDGSFLADSVVLMEII